MDHDRSQWLQLLGELPVDAEALFPETTGFFVRRRNLARARRLALLKDLLLRALEPGERIRFSLPGMRYNPLEYYLTGVLAAQLTNAQTLVVTDRRLLMFQTDHSGRPGDIKNAVALAHIRSAKKKLGARVIVELADGKRLDLIGVGKDAKRLASLLPAAPTADKVARALEHLCPECLKPTNLVPDADASCPNEACRIPFRSARRAARMSLAMPGLGDLYLRHRLFGTLELLGSTVALLAAIYLFATAAASGFQGGSAAVLAVTALLLVLVPRALDYALTLHMGRKGIVPLASRSVGAGDMTRLPFFPRWSYPLFGLLSLTVVGSTLAMIPSARIEARLNLAVEAAEAGDLATARRHYDSVGAKPGASDDSLGRLAAAFFEAGDLESGNAVLTQLGNRPISSPLASRVNDAVARIDAQRSAYQDARELLFRGEVEKGLAALDSVLPALQGIKHPRFPATREEAVLVAVEDLLANNAPSSLSAADKLLAHLTSPSVAAQAAVARGYLAAVADDEAGARAALAGVQGATLEPDWEYLRHEVRVLLAKRDEYPGLLQELEELPVSESFEVRREALLAALRGQTPAVAADVP